MPTAIGPRVNLADDAVVDESAAAGVPGTYQVGITIPAVPLSSPTRSYYDPAAWNDALRRRGLSDWNVTQVAYAGMSQARSTNWAADLIEEVAGTPSGQRVVADRYFVVTVEIAGDGSTGMGIAPAAVLGAVLAGLAIIAGTLAIIDAFSGKNFTVTFFRAIAAGISALISGATKPIADAAGSILIPAAIVVGVFLLMAQSRGGGKLSTKLFSAGG